eukprot:6191312-Pleurochrysis_carterae.AAC.2
MRVSIARVATAWRPFFFLSFRICLCVCVHMRLQRSGRDGGRRSGGVGNRERSLTKRGEARAMTPMGTLMYFGSLSKSSKRILDCSSGVRGSPGPPTGMICAKARQGQSGVRRGGTHKKI